MHSEQIGNLAKALAAAQAQIKPPKKGRTAKIKSDKGQYEYHYADLADVIECYREPLAANGLALAQSMKPQDGHLILVTVLMHQSGEWLDSEYPIAAYARPQEQGSAITYARRYAVTALLGIAAEDDDDGAAAQDATPVKREAKPEPKNGITEAEVAAVHLQAKKAGLRNAAELAPVLTNIVGVGRASDIPRSEYKNVLDALEGMAQHREVTA